MWRSDKGGHFYRLTFEFELSPRHFVALNLGKLVQL